MINICRILDMKRLNPDGLVFEVKYEFKATSGKYFENLVNSLTLEGSSASEDFIPFELLTEDVVIEWVKNKLGSGEVSSIEAGLEQKLKLKIKDILKEESNGKRISGGLPW